MELRPRKTLLATLDSRLAIERGEKEWFELVVITRTSPLIRHSCLTPGAKNTVVMAAPSELRGSVQKSHRRRRPRQSPQQLPGLAAVKEVARLRRGGRMFVSRLPYQHLIKEVARPLQNKVNIFYYNIFCKFAK